MRFAQWFRLSPRCGYHQPTIQSKQVQHHYSGFKYIYIDVIRRYTLVYMVYAGMLVYAWYTRGIRVVYTRFFSGIRVVYARYARGSVVCTWYTRGIRWYTTLMAPQPQNGENRQWWSFQSEVKDLPKLLGTWLRTDAARL